VKPILQLINKAWRFIVANDKYDDDRKRTDVFCSDTAININPTALELAKTPQDC
jgi:phosphotransacetylase